MLLFSQLPTARPQQQPVAPPALVAWSRSARSSASTSCSRPTRLGLPPAAARRASISCCRTTSISSSRPPVATHRCSGSRAERATRGGAQETNAGAKMVDLRCGAGRSYGTVAPPPPLASRERVYRGSSDGAAFPHPVWQGSAWSRSPFWSPAKQGRN